MTRAQRNLIRNWGCVRADEHRVEDRARHQRPAIKAHLKDEGNDVEKIEVAKFERLRARISDDYSHSMKTVSFLTAFVVAFCFQVSATKLLRDLSISEPLRTKALELGQSLPTDPDTQATLVPFATQTEKALAEVREKFPSAAGALEQISGVSDTRQEWVTELRQILKGDPDITPIIATFQTSLDRQTEERTKAAESAGQAAQVSLATLDIHFLEDLCFYRHAPHCTAAPATQQPGIIWSNLAGVLMTGILLTFGAPFWYEKLKDLNIFQNQLRGALKKETRELVSTITEAAPAPTSKEKPVAKEKEGPQSSVLTPGEVTPGE